MSFNVGDKVRVTNYPTKTCPLLGQVILIDEILSVSGKFLYKTKHLNNFWYFYEHELELVEPIKTQTVSHLPEGFVVLKPDEKWVPGMAQPQPITQIISTPKGKNTFYDSYAKTFNGSFNTAPKKCTCGIASIGGGMHSDWCDLYQEQTNG